MPKQGHGSGSDSYNKLLTLFDLRILFSLVEAKEKTAKDTTQDPLQYDEPRQLNKENFQDSVYFRDIST